METHLDKPCNLCGGVGFPDLIIACFKCNVTRKHVYCMSEFLKVVPENWVCKSCSSQKSGGKVEHDATHLSGSSKVHDVFHDVSGLRTCSSSEREIDGGAPLRPRIEKKCRTYHTKEVQHTESSRSVGDPAADMEDISTPAAYSCSSAASRAVHDDGGVSDQLASLEIQMVSIRDIVLKQHQEVMGELHNLHNIMDSIMSVVLKQHRPGVHHPDNDEGVDMNGRGGGEDVDKDSEDEKDSDGDNWGGCKSEGGLSTGGGDGIVGGGDDGEKDSDGIDRGGRGRGDIRGGKDVVGGVHDEAMVDDTGASKGVSKVLGHTSF